MSIEEFIEKRCGTEEKVVDDNVIYNRGIFTSDMSFPEIEADLPEGTTHYPALEFNPDPKDRKNRLYFNREQQYVVGASKRSYSIHVWRYPNREVYDKHFSDIVDFFGARLKRIETTETRIGGE